MKIRTFIPAVVLSAAILLASCAGTPRRPSVTEGEESFSATVTAEVADRFADVRNSGETWLSYGLSAYENGREAEDLKDFFSDSANLTYLTLYDHLFAYDREKSIPVAEALFAFICGEYGADALLDVDRRCEYKTAYLHSLGLDTDYTQMQEVEAFFTAMEFATDAASGYPYVISFGNVTYCFKEFGTPTQYNGFLYYSTKGLSDLIQYLRDHRLDEHLDTERDFRYYVSFEGGSSSRTVAATGEIYLHDSYSALHEAMHAMGVGLKKEKNVWLSEGICVYFGETLGLNKLVTAADLQLLTMTERGYFDARADAGDPSATFYRSVYREYTDRGGQVGSGDAFDLFLYTDVSAMVELEIGSFATLEDAYRTAGGAESDAIGLELSYNQAASLVHYLAETYGIERVFEAYRTQEIETVFGKDYEGLKADWLAYMGRQAG